MPPPEAAQEESSSRPVTRSDADDAPIEVEGPPRKRKSVALIAVGAVLGACVIVGGVALLSGTTKDPAPKTATTAAADVTATAARHHRPRAPRRRPPPQPDAGAAGDGRDDRAHAPTRPAARHQHPDGRAARRSRRRRAGRAGARPGRP